MLTISNTPNYAGIEISGDYDDLDALYMSLIMIIGDEGEYGGYEGARLRVLGMCYDIRHAFQGDREVEFVPNGMDADMMRMRGLIAPENNLYYACQVYYPEALFVIIALNDFVRLYAKKNLKSSSYAPLLEKENLWDTHIAHVRLFQSMVVNSLKEVVTEASFKRMMNLMHKKYPWTDGYVTQYLDLLNIRYLEIASREARAKALSTTVKRMVEQWNEYREVEAEIKEMAKENHCSLTDIGLIQDYPEEINW